MAAGLGPLVQASSWADSADTMDLACFVIKRLHVIIVPGVR